MTIFCWTVAAFMTLGGLLTVMDAMQAKKPKSVAAVAVSFDAAVVTGLVLIALGVWRR